MTYTSSMNPRDQRPDPAHALLERLAALDTHFDRIVALMAKAEDMADAMIHSMGERRQHGGEDQPEQLKHVCRALHVLAQCGLVLRRQLKLAAGQGKAQLAALSDEDAAKMAARLYPLLSQLTAA